MGDVIEAGRVKPSGGGTVAVAIAVAVIVGGRCRNGTIETDDESLLFSHYLVFCRPLMDTGGPWSWFAHKIGGQPAPRAVPLPNFDALQLQPHTDLVPDRVRPSRCGAHGPR